VIHLFPDAELVVNRMRDDARMRVHRGQLLVSAVGLRHKDEFAYVFSLCGG
jgi:hypothetical protein